MVKEIGSNFWLSPQEIAKKNDKLITPEIFGCEGSDYVWLSTGRSAISYVLDTIKVRNPDIRTVACIPAFTCDTVYEPFYKSEYEVIAIPCDEKLQISGSAILEYARKYSPGIILIHKYFGFNTCPNLDNIIPELHKMGITVIEDVTQSMYSKFSKSNADYIVGSIRKWCGVPDGGFAVCREGTFLSKPHKSDIKLEQLKQEAALLKYEYIFNDSGDKQLFLNKFKEAEDLLDAQSELYAISPLSYNLQCVVDLQKITDKRRANYLQLLNCLKGIVGINPIFNNLPSDVTPLYLPVICDDRKKLQSLLVENNIFAPVVWPKGNNCPQTDNKVNYIYNHILCIPIDQRYNTDDIERITNVIHKEYIWTGWMDWSKIEPFKEQLIDWEQEVVIKHHYPDRKIPRSFSEVRVDNLKNYLSSGNTFFWGAIFKGKLIGYYWAYATEFLYEKVWDERSSYLLPEFRGFGLGMKAKLDAMQKAKEIECVKARSMYAPFNDIQRNIYEKLGYHVSRIEVTKKL